MCKRQNRLISKIKKEPVAWITLFVTLVLGVINNDRIMSCFEGNLSATIGSDLIGDGRCIDKEIFVENLTGELAENIRITFDVDYMTRRGDIEIYYGDEKAVLMTTAVKTLIPRRDYIPVAYEIEPKNHVLIIPKLLPGQYVHLFFGGESPVNSNIFEKRNEQIKAKQKEFMNTPRIASIHYDGGDVKISRFSGNKCRT